jgi:3-deoxy-D-manno-octulosonic acid (KDO) 8-phosphate synthase
MDAPGGVRRHPFRAAAGRAGRIQWRRAALRAVLARAAVAVGVAAVFIEMAFDAVAKRR